jgi:putative membrane protein insertion efficiency factor
MIKQHASSPKRSGSFNSSSESTQGFRGAVVLRALLQGYRLLVSPLLPRACRFYPSCSQFALEALSEHGAVNGTRLTAARIARCHPWNPGGYDPVPPRKA